MRRILSRIASLLRRRRSTTKGPVALLGLDILMDTSSAQATEAQDDLARRLALMPLFVRETFLLRAVDRMTVDEISAGLGISRRSVRRYMRKAIELLAATDKG